MVTISMNLTIKKLCDMSSDGKEMGLPEEIATLIQFHRWHSAHVAEQKGDGWCS